MSSCHNPQCYCSIADCSKHIIDIGITATYDDLADLINAQRNILNKINKMQLASYDDVEINTQVKDLIHMLEMVRLKLEFWDFQHHKTLSLDNKFNSDECELVILDNEVAQSCNPNSEISGEDELEAEINKDDNQSLQQDDITNPTDFDTDVEEIQLHPSNNNNDDAIDDTDIQDIDLELESVDMHDTNAADDINDQPASNASFCCDGSGCEICLTNALKHGIIGNNTTDTINGPNMNSMKDLMSMLFMMSMATDSDSVIRKESPPPPDDLD
jgi:hypothetical protein